MNCVEYWFLKGQTVRTFLLYGKYRLAFFEIKRPLWRQATFLKIYLCNKPNCDRMYSDQEGDTVLRNAAEKSVNTIIQHSFSIKKNE